MAVAHPSCLASPFDQPNSRQPPRRPIARFPFGGLPKGRPTLVCGSAGCGKTLLGMEFLVRGAIECREPGVFLAFEERAEELAQNVASLGFDLPALCADKKLLLDHVRIERRDIEETGEYDLEGLFARLGHAIDSIKATLLCTSLTAAGDREQQSEVGVSSLMDTWLLVRNLEAGGERNRGLYILKSRGMGHSNQVREFVLSDSGIELIAPYLGPHTVLTGSARAAQEARDRAEAVAAEQEMDRQRAIVEAKVAALHAELRSEEEALKRLGSVSARRTKEFARHRAEMVRMRGPTGLPQ